MASKQQRGENSWLFVVELGRDAKGKRLKETTTYTVTDPALLKSAKKLEQHLQAELIKFEMLVKSGHYIAPGRMTFVDFLKAWETNYVDIELEKTSKGNYLFHVEKRIKPYFETMFMEEIKTMHILAFFKKMRHPKARLDGKGPLKSATLVYVYRVLKSIFNKAQEWKVIAANPMEGVKKPKEDDIKEMDIYDENEIKELFVALENEPLHIRVQVTLAVTTGMRRGEMAGLEWSRIDLDSGHVYISQTIPKFIGGEPYLKPYPKNKKPRKIALSGSVIDELLEFKAIRDSELEELVDEQWMNGKHSFLFCHPNGKPFDPQTLTDRWIDFHRRHKLKPIRLHDLRHTSAAWMIYKQVHSEAIARRLGHSNIKMLKIYGHIFESVDQAAAAVFDDIRDK